MDFSEVERFAKHFDDPTRDAWQRPAEVIRLLEIVPGQKVVDLGAGTGYFVPHLAKAVGAQGSVLALDVEPNMVRYMKERVAKAGLHNVHPQQVTPDEPSLPDASIDRILIVNTWHHIDQRPGYASKLKRALRDNGTLTIVDFTKESDEGPPAAHRLTPEQVMQELTLGGLHPRIVVEQLPKQYVVRASSKP